MGTRIMTRWVAVLMFLVLLLSACGSKQSGTTAGSESSSTGTSSSSTSSAKTGPVTLRFVAPAYDDGVEAWARQFESDFNSQDPNVQVKVEVVPWNELQDKLTREVGAGNPPDLSMIATLWVPQYADAGKVVAWDDVATDLVETFIPSMLEYSRFREKLYSLPYLATTRALYINDDLFRAAGLDPAKPLATWDDFLKTAQATTKPGEQYGLAMPGKGFDAIQAWWLYFLWSFGGDVLDASGKPVFNSPEGVAAVQFMGDLANTYKVTEPDITANDTGEYMALFKSGKAAMTISGPWLIDIMKKEAPNINFSVAPIPRGKAEANLSVTDALVMFSDSKHQQEAIKLAKFFLSPQQHAAYVSGRGMLPVLKASLSDPVFTSDPRLKAHVDLLPTARFAPAVPEWPRITDEALKALQAVYLGQKDAKAALDEAVANLGY